MEFPGGIDRALFATPMRSDIGKARRRARRSNVTQQHIPVSVEGHRDTRAFPSTCRTETGLAAPSRANVRVRAAYLLRRKCAQGVAASGPRALDSQSGIRTTRECAEPRRSHYFEPDAESEYASRRLARIVRIQKRTRKSRRAVSYFLLFYLASRAERAPPRGSSRGFSSSFSRP